MVPHPIGLRSPGHLQRLTDAYIHKHILIYIHIYVYICYVHTHKFLSTCAHMHVPQSIHYQYHTHTLTYIHTDACMHYVTIYAQFYIPSTEVMLECHSHSKGEGTDSLIFLKKSVTTGSAAIVCVLINGNAKQIKNVK